MQPVIDILVQFAAQHYVILLGVVGIDVVLNLIPSVRANNTFQLIFHFIEGLKDAAGAVAQKIQAVKPPANS